MPVKTQIRKRKLNLETQQYLPEEHMPVVVYARRGRHRHYTLKAKATRPRGARGI